MKFFKYYIFIFFVTFSVRSQIVITEVYYDSPYHEDLQEIYHHSGEFIELFNYSDKDISLKNWSVTDYIGRYQFPDNAVIKSRDFLILAYRDSYLTTHYGAIPTIGNINYFSSFFPNTVGQESKIIYQDKIILRNLGETLRLHVGNIGTTNCKNFKIDEKEVGHSYTLSGSFLVSRDCMEDPNTYDFYQSVSVQLGSNGNFYDGSPTPLYASYVPPIQHFEDIPTVLEALHSVYNTMTWEEYSNEILNNTCPFSIADVAQTSPNNNSTNGINFNYDSSGNTTDIIPGNPLIPSNPNTPGYTESQIADFESKIVLYPNPTLDFVNVTWDAAINGKIVKMDTSNSSGVNVSSLPISNTQTSEVIDLSNKPSGIYIVKILLDSGQFISKNIIKV